MTPHETEKINTQNNDPRGTELSQGKLHDIIKPIEGPAWTPVGPE